jgi:hypothetical protein
MSVVVHGDPGQTLAEAGAAHYGRDAARRGLWFEGVTARALERWLAARPVTVHLFHDLTGFQRVEGHGYQPLSLGTANIDHVILTGAGWVLVNAKGCAAGVLGTDVRGRGILTQPDGTVTRQPWLDDRRSYSHAGALVRLTGLKGWMVWLVPDKTSLTDPSLTRARCFRSGGTILTVGELLDGGLMESPEIVELLSLHRRAAPSAIAALDHHVARPGQRTIHPDPASVRYPWASPAC